MQRCDHHLPTCCEVKRVHREESDLHIQEGAPFACQPQILQEHQVTEPRSWCRSSRRKPTRATRETIGTSSRIKWRPHRQHHQVARPPATAHISSPCRRSTSALHPRASSWASRGPRPHVRRSPPKAATPELVFAKPSKARIHGIETRFLKRSAGSSAQGALRPLAQP